METSREHTPALGRRDVRLALELTAADVTRLQAWARRERVSGDLETIAEVALHRFLDDAGIEGVPARHASRIVWDLEPIHARREVAPLTAFPAPDLEDVPAGDAPLPPWVHRRRRAAVPGPGMVNWRREARSDYERATKLLSSDRAAAKLFMASASRALGYRARDISDAAILVPPMSIDDPQPPLAPEDVTLGLLPDERVDFALELPLADGAAQERTPERAPLTGLTNRLAPTFWGASMLVRMAGGGGAVRISHYLEHVLPVAWRIGAGLKASEEERRRELRRQSGSKRKGLAFAWSARWPTPSGTTSREASAAMTFVKSSLGNWNERTGVVDGPLFTFGLAEVMVPADPDDHWCIRPTAHALRLSRALGESGASCDYPYSDATWMILRDALADTLTDELGRAVSALIAVRDSDDTASFQENVGRLLGDGRSTAIASEASGHLARLRELGLVGIDGPPLGPGAITERGIQLLRDMA